MPTAEAHVPTERPSRFLVQLCRHASQMSRHRMIRLPAHTARDTQAGYEMPNDITAEWSDTHGTVSVDGGTCTLRATPDALNLRIDADDEDTLHRMQELVTRNLTRFSRRDPLMVSWNRIDPPTETGDPTAARSSQAVTPHARRRTVLLIAIGILAVAAHVVLGGAVLAAPQWTALAADAVLAIVLINAVLLTMGYLAHRRRKAAKSR